MLHCDCASRRQQLGARSRTAKILATCTACQGGSRQYRQSRRSDVFPRGTPQSSREKAVCYVCGVTLTFDGIRFCTLATARAQTVFADTGLCPCCSFSCIRQRAMRRRCTRKLWQRAQRVACAGAGRTELDTRKAQMSACCRFTGRSVSDHLRRGRVKLKVRPKCTCHAVIAVVGRCIRATTQLSMARDGHQAQHPWQ